MPNEQLIADLRARLEEAEETLRAIHEGEVDAIVVSGSQGDRVFMLSEPDSLPRWMVETMNEAGLAVTPAGLLVFANARAEILLGRPKEQLLAHDLGALVAPADTERFRQLLRTDGRDDARIEFVGATGTPVALHIWASRLNRPQQDPLICLLATDLSRVDADRRLISRLQEQQQQLREARVSALNLMQDAVAARHQAEHTAAALEIAERRTQQALKASHSFTFEWDTASDEVLRSESAGPILRLSGEAAFRDTGTGFFQRIHPDDRDRFLRLIQATSPGAADYTCEYRVQRGDGGMVTLEDTGQAQFSANGKMGRLFGVTTDISERKRMEAALRESEERFRIAAENLTDVIFDWDLKEMIGWHGNIDGMTGFPPGEFPRTLEAWAAILHSEDKDRVMAALEAHLKGEAPYVVEYRVKRTDGAWRWWTARGTALRDAQGKPYRMIGSISDITEHKYTEDALRESQQANAQKAELLRQAPVIAAFHDRDNNIIWANRAYEEATGLLLQDIVGKKCYSAWNLSGTCQGCPVPIAIATGKHSEAELTPQNQKYWPESLASWLTRAAPVHDKEGNIIGAIEVAINITERKRAEASLRETNQALEAATARANELAKQADVANRAKSVFLANMSHEIRTPLNAVLGFAQILERDASLTPRQTGMLHTIGRSGRHLLDLINDILDMSKIESGRLELIPTDFCLHDLLDDLEMMFRSRAHAKQLHLRMERDGSVPRYVNADEGKLRQVLINLIGNAIKFTRAGGGFVRVQAETEPCNSVGEANAIRLVVEVEDSGPGIAEEELDHIFEPFRQSAAGREAGGTGLGLAVSRRLVELMGGRLTVMSQVGKGSCFRFDVLVKLAEGAPQETTPTMRQVVGLEPGAGPYRILVVDDQKDNRDLLAALLEPLGFEIREAVNGQEALDLFAAWSPHAILMDMRMPTLDGYEATRRIKATGKGRATPVIAVTASAFAEAQREVLAAGVDGYVCKPFRAEELFAVLGKCLGLRYVYANPFGQAPLNAGVQPLTREDLAALPESRQQAMRQAVDEGDMVGLRALIAQIEETDAEIASKLRNLADQYDYGSLTHLLGDRKDQKP